MKIIDWNNFGSATGGSTRYGYRKLGEDNRKGQGGSPLPFIEGDQFLLKATSATRMVAMAAIAAAQATAIRGMLL